MKEEDLISILKRNGYKVTTQRLAICKIILSRKDHPSTEQIYQAIKEKYPTISLGTVYKTLHLLEEIGLIQELGFNKESIRYDPNTKLHINLICTQCFEIQDYEPTNLDTLWSKIVSQLSITPNGQRIDIYYECDKCKNAPNN